MKGGVKNGFAFFIGQGRIMVSIAIACFSLKTPKTITQRTIGYDMPRLLQQHRFYGVSSIQVNTLIK
jgi:hypothetical protein